MWEIIKNLSGWAKITGASIPILVIFLLILQASGEKEAIELPSTIEEIKENATPKAIEETTNSGIIIIKQFHEVGKTLAKDVNDPIAAQSIEGSMSFAGVMLALGFVFAVVSALKKAFGG